MAKNGQAESDAVDVRDSVSRDSVNRFRSAGNVLLVELTNGEIIRISDLYGGAANGEVHRLMYVAGSYSDDGMLGAITGSQGSLGAITGSEGLPGTSSGEAGLLSALTGSEGF